MLQRIDGETGVPVRGEGVFFRMRNGRRTVRFFASSGLLEALTHSTDIDEREAFLSCRRDVEMLAGECFAARLIDDDTVIWITEDVLPRQPFRPALPAFEACCA